MPKIDYNFFLIWLQVEEDEEAGEDGQVDPQAAERQNRLKSGVRSAPDLDSGGGGRGGGRRRAGGPAGCGAPKWATAGRK